MKNKYFLLTALAVICYLPGLKAQNVSYGLLVGPSTRNVSYGSGDIFKHPDFGADAGILAEIRFSELFSFQPMLEYSAQGSKHNAFVSPDNYDPMQYPNDVKFAELNYLMVPMLAKVGWHLGDQSHMRFFINAGPYAAFLLSANQVLITQNEQKIDGTSVNVKSELNTFNAGFDGNVGLSYFFHLSSVFVQAGGNYGFLKIQKDQSAGANYAGGASLTVGYTFWFDDNFLTNGHFAPKR
jgi:hypothetical protein